MNPSVSPLVKASNSNTNSFKYYIDCYRISKEELTTEKWLTVEDRLKATNFDDKNRILLGILIEHQQKRVVIKIGTSITLEKEYNIAKRLSSNEGFINFICFFRCNDDYKEHPNPTRKHLCKGPGDQMSCIVMPYFPKGNMRTFQFREVPNGLAILKSLLKIIYISMTKAFVDHGILHTDTHAQNILISDTSRKQIYNIDLLGYKPVIMDLENALISADKNSLFVYRDFGRLIADLHYNSELYLDKCFDLLHVIEHHGSVNSDFDDAKSNIFSVIDSLSFKNKPSMSFTHNPNIF
jgi:serine/threonine protein kinase